MTDSDPMSQGRDGAAIDPAGRDRAVYIISVAAELTGVHPQTLRVYERKGLVEPARTGGMSRRYSQADIERIRQIQALTTQGLNLVGVRRVLELENEVAALRSQLEELAARTRADLVPLRQEMVIYQQKRQGKR